MPETYGLPEPEPTTPDKARLVLNEVVAGQSVVRTVALYVITALVLLTPWPEFGMIPLMLLFASDVRMS